MLRELPFWIVNTLFTVNRWVHIVATALLVGGILFLEFVVPRATEDLKDDQRLAVFGKARYQFHRVVWLCGILLLVTGAVSTWRMWPQWIGDEKIVGPGSDVPAFWLVATPWFLVHMLLGIVAIGLILRVTAGRRLLQRPVWWMQVILMVLLVSIFLAAAGRNVRMRLHEFRDSANKTDNHEM